MANVKLRTQRRFGLLDVFTTVTFAVILTFLIRIFVAQVFFIPSESMVPTLHIDDRVVVEKISYRYTDVGRGDVVVFERPEKLKFLEADYLIKRVVGLPGETVSAENGVVSVNGQVLDEPWLNGVTTLDFEPVKVKPGEYFLMGDNRLGSEDSRYFGSINKNFIVGRAVFVAWPLSNIQGLT